MGVFDVARPIVFAVDDLLAFLPPVVRLLFWATLAGFVGMAIYRWTSPQEKLQQLKIKVREDRRAMLNFDGEADEMWPVLSASLSSSLKHVGLTFGAALLAGLPVLLLISPVAQRYGPGTPTAGAEISMQAIGATEARWQWDRSPSTLNLGPQNIATMVMWPGAGETETLTANGRPVVTLPLAPGSSVVHKKVWWNALFANPAGYLDENAPVQALQFDLPAQQFLAFGPPWMRSWMLTFFVALIAVSLILKIWWKIE